MPVAGRPAPLDCNLMRRIRWSNGRVDDKEKQMNDCRISRRGFLGGVIATGAAPVIVPYSTIDALNEIRKRG